MPSKAKKLGDHAVVLGASMAGMMSARVLADFYREVTVVERDILPSEPVSRRGVPQGRMIHALGVRSVQVLDELFPGFVDQLAADGVHVWMCNDFSRANPSVSGHRLGASGGRASERKALPQILPSRPLLDWHVCRRLRAVPNVAILEGHDVAGLTASADHDRITGARVVARDSGAETTLSADLVVDATGKGSRTPAFLEELGHARPTEDELVVHLTYACQMIRIPPGAVNEYMTIVHPAPGRPRLFALFEYERDQWIFALGGMAGLVPPKELEDRLEFAADFAPPHLLDAIRAAEPLGEVSHYRVPANRWRRYDKMRRTPEGLLVIGDAVCSFNPIYGQGITTAACQVMHLRDSLRRGNRNLAPRFFRASAKSLRMAWMLTISADLSLPEVEGPRPLWVRVAMRLMDAALVAAERDVDCAQSLLRIIGMVDATPLQVARPAFVYRVVKANLRRQAAGQHSASAQVHSGVT